ncbi:hypothetical protein F5B20DRAFT_586822 [Whalleya microplaca]|nr:hypothetical protein F5B20DRAFT_586822 [Whalleya microplaca]
MMASFIQLLLVLVLAIQALALTARDLFDVDFNANFLGGCQWAGEDKINRMLAESVTLANRGIEAVNDYGDPIKPEAKRLIDAWFKPQNADDRLAIRERFTRVRDWVQNGGPLSHDRNVRPRLFCHHGWAEKLKMESQYRDANGNYVSNLDGTPVLIRDVPDMVEARSIMANDMDLRINYIYPYWNRITRTYWFDKRYSNGGYNTGWCSGNVGAMTFHVQNVMASITLCPLGLGTTNQRPSNWVYHPLRETQPIPITSQQVAFNQMPPLSQIVTDLAPTAANLFHELFHLVLGSDNSAPPYPPGEVYQITPMLGLTFNLAIVNPETFVTVAVAYDYTRSIDRNPQGERVEFFTGYTTQG